MKLALALLLLTSPCFAFRNVAISSTTDPAVWENLRRASVDINRKLDRFSNEKLFGQPTFVNGVKFGDGTIQNTAIASTAAFVQKAGDTMTGALTMSASSITIRYTGNAPLSISQNSTVVSDILTNTGLSMIGADNTATRFGLRTYGIAGSGAYAQRRARGTAASPSAVTNGDQLLSLEGWGYGTTGWLATPHVMVRGWAADTWTDSYAPTYLSLWTTQTLVPAERMRITAVGNVGISTIAPVAALGVSGGIIATSSITAQGGFYGDGSTLSGILTSTAVIQSSITAIYTLHSDVQDPTGFYDGVASSMTLTGRVFSISTMSGTGPYYIYDNGIKIAKTSDTVTIPNATQLNWIYFTTGGVLTQSTSFPGFFEPLVASVYYSTAMAAGWINNERHTAIMDWRTHEYAHETIGSRWASGMTGTFSATAGTVTAGEFYDDDLEIITPQTSRWKVLYKSGGTTDYKFYYSSNPFYYSGVSNINWLNGSAMSEAGANRFVAYWIVATSDLSAPFMVLPGTREDTSIANAQANNTPDTINTTGLPMAEYKIIYRVILKNALPPTYIEATDYRNVTNLPSGTYAPTSHASLTDLSLTASAHPYDSSGGFASYDTLIASDLVRIPYTGASGSVSLGSYGLTASSVTTSTIGFVSGVSVSSATAAQYGGVYISSNIYVAGKYYGDGSGLTGLTGANLSSTQTFTGSNTFSQTGAGVTTISSASITSAVIPTITGNTSFGTATATTTFSGWVDIGYEIIYSSSAGATTLAVACSSGKRPFSAQGFSGTKTSYGAYTNPLGASPSGCRIDQTTSGELHLVCICARVK